MCITVTPIVPICIWVVVVRDCCVLCDAMRFDAMCVFVSLIVFGFGFVDLRIWFLITIYSKKANLKFWSFSFSFGMVGTIIPIHVTRTHMTNSHPEIHTKFSLSTTERNIGQSR